MQSKSNLARLLPVLFGFFIMGFCDVVGISTSYVKIDFSLNETVAGFIPSMVFIWFLLLSLPSALLMNRYGRKRMVIVSNVITFVGMLIPFVSYNLFTCMTAFLLLGVGNTILQVSLNPLLNNVVNGKALASALTAGQVIKAISSLCGPLIAGFATVTLGNWQYLFPIYAVITLISTLWLLLVPIREEKAEQGSTIGATLALLRDNKILLLFLGIFFVVGADVGFNTVAPKLLIERCGFAVQDAGYGSSIYFLCRTAGAFVGTLLLAKLPAIKYFRINMIAAIAAIAALFFCASEVAILTVIGLLGFFCSSVFSIIYAEALVARPDKENEISGLMIMGVCGGAVIPPVMGFLADTFGSQAGSLTAIAVCILFLTYCSFALRNKKDI